MFGNKSQPKGERETVLVSLTSLGRQQSEQFDTGGPMVQTLIILSESGPMSINELRKKLEERGARIEYNQFRQFLRGMQKRGLIQPTTSNGEYPTP